MEQIRQLLTEKSAKRKSIAVLVDPDKYDEENYKFLNKGIDKNLSLFFLVGGSLLSKNNLDRTVKSLKEITGLPVYLFPGHTAYLSAEADGLLFLSLISGRNPEFLIGQQVIAAPMIKEMGIETIPTGYILIDGGVATSVSYMSNTTPIPAHKADIVAATALAGELLGLKTLYLEAGSGALFPVSEEVIKKVRKTVSLPLIVGGGIRSIEQINKSFDAGADVVVIGTAIEDNPEFLQELLKIEVIKL